MRLGGSGGSERLMGEWLVGQWIVGVISFQEIFGLCVLQGHIVEIKVGIDAYPRPDDARNVKIELEFWILNSQQHEPSQQSMIPTVEELMEC